MVCGDLLYHIFRVFGLDLLAAVLVEFGSACFVYLYYRVHRKGFDEVVVSEQEVGTHGFAVDILAYGFLSEKIVIVTVFDGAGYVPCLHVVGGFRIGECGL